MCVTAPVHWRAPAGTQTRANRACESARCLSRMGMCHRSFLAASIVLFGLSTAVTIPWCASMAAMGGMPMAGGWTLSMAWMPMAGETWATVAASFLGMWTVMMVAMMLPALMPLLWRYREALGDGSGHPLGPLTTLAALGYFCVWIACGTGAFALGATLAALEMRLPWMARAAPLAAGVVVLLAGVLQFTAWKARQLACCRQAPAHEPALSARAASAWRHGLRLGLRCNYCCGGLTAILLALGIMDVRVMGLVTLAISAERLAPGGVRIARATGALAVGGGLLLITRAAGL